MKEKEINLPSLRRFKSSRLCFFSPLKILQVTELAADVSSQKHLLELLVVDHELRSSSMKNLSISLRGPAAKQGDEKLVYRLIQLFPSTEIFSKRRKICTLWRKTRATDNEDVTAVCRKRYANASGNNLEPRSFLLLGLLPMGMRMRINRWQYCIENEGELRLILWKFLIRCSWFLNRLLIHFSRLHSAWCSK